MISPVQTGLSQEQKEKNLMVLFVAIVISLLIYILVCEMILKFEFKAGHPGYAPLPPEIYGMIRTVLMCLSAVGAVILAAIRLALNSGNPSGFIKLFFQPAIATKSEDVVMAQAFTIYILAMCMNIGVFGFVLFLLNGIKDDAYPLMILCFLLMAMFMPTKSYIEKLGAIRKANQQI